VTVVELDTEPLTVAVVTVAEFSQVLAAVEKPPNAVVSNTSSRGSF
jgi:hypothetical protein